MFYVFNDNEEVIITEHNGGVTVTFPYLEHPSMELRGKWDIRTRNRCDDTGIVIRKTNKPYEEVFLIDAKRVVLKHKEVTDL